MKTLALTAAVFCVAVAALAQAPPATPTPVPATPAPVNEEFAKAVFFGQKFFAMKDYGAAYQQFARADAITPDNAGILYDMALTLAQSGRYSEAQSKVDRYNQLFPSGAEKPLIAKLQLELEFQRELQKKRQADEDYVELFTRGRFLYTKGDLESAMKLFRDAEQKRPNDPAPVYNEGEIYEKMGDLPKAVERFQRFEELSSDAEQKTLTDQHLLALESDIDDMKTKIVCPFCGLRLPIGAAWCPRCWHGPYLTSSAVWNTRPCGDGASATRATYYTDGRFAKNDSLPCLYTGSMLDAFRYTPAKQKAIQEARKSEGWVYKGDIIQGKSDVELVQGPAYLEKTIASAIGDVLRYTAHPSGAAWLLDREDMVIDGIHYTSHYTFDAQNRIAQQQVDYQNTAGCNHFVAMTANYTYTGDALSAAKINGGYDGYQVEGSPRVDWETNIVWTYDPSGRVAKEDLSLSSFTKTYKQRPYGAERDEISKLYPAMRVGRPVENIARTGDLCGTNGTLLLGNPIDLRPFYAMSPNTSMLLPFGVTRASVSFTYPTK